jgi:hypothetical protein
MINALLAPAPVYEAFIQGSRALGGRLLSLVQWPADHPDGITAVDWPD